MGLEEVKKEILNRAEKEIVKIGAEVKKEIKVIQEQSKNEVKERKSQVEHSRKSEIERLRRIREAESKAETMNLLLEKKRELMDEVMTKALEKLKKQSVKKDYLKKLLTKAKKELDVDRVYCKKDSAKDLDVTVVNKDIDGLIAENNDGSISIDYSFDTLITDIRESNLKEIAEILFQ